ncbi:hypothetical protein BDZ89DRAFT_1130305 [Hymenopellis radicata]|nr:hypothetical protein BDZ89DRAFT_1130305 [Hymenopellis radicata]
MSASAIADTSDSASTKPPPEGVDWQNVTSDTPVDSSGLPLDVWAPLLPRDTGLSFPRAQVEAQARCDAEVTDARRRQTRGWTRHEEEADPRRGRT